MAGECRRVPRRQMQVSGAGVWAILHGGRGSGHADPQNFQFLPPRVGARAVRCCRAGRRRLTSTLLPLYGLYGRRVQESATTTNAGFGGGGVGSPARGPGFRARGPPKLSVSAAEGRCQGSAVLSCRTTTIDVDVTSSIWLIWQERSGECHDDKCRFRGRGCGQSCTFAGVPGTRTPKTFSFCWIAHNHGTLTGLNN